MQTQDLRIFLTNHYSYNGKTIQLKNGGNAIVDVVSIANSASAPYINVPPNTQISTVQPYYLLCGETLSPSTSYLRDELNKAGYVDDDYIVSHELCLQPQFMKTLRQQNFASIISQIKTNYDVGIYRADRTTAKPHNSYYLVLIRVKENNQYTTKYLDAYFASSDSRTYSDLTYKINILSQNNVVHNTKDETDWPRNLLVFGAPGTGKSFAIDKKIAELGWQENMERVTFYEEYSYEKFVGQYVPKKGKKQTKIIGTITTNAVSLDTEGQGIVYEFVPGVFLKMIADAWFSQFIKENTNYVLVIEEMNRANAASVFGDMFQLLDRNADGESEYTITLSGEMKEWLQSYLEEKGKNLTIEEEKENLPDYIDDYSNHFKIPKNLYLWATMNSADQGVFPLDSAFKRRWSFIYKSVSEPRTDNNQYIYTYINEKPSIVSWDDLRDAINSVMGNPENNIEEDRFIGAWYFKKEEMHQIYRYTRAVEQGQKDIIDMLSNPLCDKLFQYLRQDVFRNNPSGIFHENYHSMYKIREAMKEKTSLENILKISLEQKSFKMADEIEFVLSTEMAANITLKELKEESKGKTWEISDDFVMDMNKTCRKEAISTSKPEEIERLINETISLLEENIKNGKNGNDEKQAIEDFEQWIKTKEQEKKESETENQTENV